MLNHVITDDQIKTVLRKCILLYVTQDFFIGIGVVLKLYFVDVEDRNFRIAANIGLYERYRAAASLVDAIFFPRQVFCKKFVHGLQGGMTCH